VIAAGRIPVLVGGDCSITVGAVAGCLSGHPDTGLLYFDGDSDLRTPQTTTAGNFDGMVIAALLGEGDPGYTGLAGQVPMLPPERLALLGYDDTDIDPAERHLLGLPFGRADGRAVAADPAGAAAAARRHVEASAGAILVHFDVDAVDSADLPLANYPHHGKGVSFAAAMTVLRALCDTPALAGVVLTEVNPTHDPGGEQLGRYTSGVAAAIAGAGAG
jgi:arginase